MRGNPLHSMHGEDVKRLEIASEKRWQLLFNDPRSETILEHMVAEVLAEDANGETEDITFLLQ